MNAPTRPALRYHGSKWKLAPWLIGLFPAHRIYVEPFGGGASVLLRKPRSYAEVYNDLDGEVVNVFLVLRDREMAAELERRLRLTPFAREEFETSYLYTENQVEWARRTIIRSFMGFGSDGINDARMTGFRATSNRSGTTPAHDWQHYPHQIKRYVERLQGVVIENRDWREVIAQHDSPNTLFYLDPPYVHGTRTRGYEKRYRHEFTDADHAELAGVLRQVAGAVVVSGYPCEMYDDLYAGWRTETRAALADGALARTEKVWLSFEGQPRMW